MLYRHHGIDPADHGIDEPLQSQLNKIEQTIKSYIIVHRQACEYVPGITNADMIREIVGQYTERRRCECETAIREGC